MRGGGEKAAEKDRGRSRKLQKGFKGQFSLQEQLMCLGPRTRGACVASWESLARPPDLACD